MHEAIETHAIKPPECRRTLDTPVALALPGTYAGINQAQPSTKERATDAIREFDIVGGLLDPIDVSGLRGFPFHSPGQVET